MITLDRILIVLVTVGSTVVFVPGCGQTPMPEPDAVSHSKTIEGHSANRAASSAPSSPTFVVPDHVTSILKQKCYVCHGGGETKGGFDLRQMVYQTDREAPWQPMDLTGVTRIKLAILPVDGKPARMPRKAGSIWNPLSVEEANAIAKWTDDPYER